MVSDGYRIVLSACRLSAARPWTHQALDMTDAPFDWLHLHDAIEFGVCLSGKGSWVVGGRRLPFVAGHAIVIAPGVPHWGISDRGVRSRWEFLMVEPSLLVHGHQQDREVLDAGFAGAGFPVMLDPRVHADACVLVREAVLEAGRALPGHKAAVRGLCWAALARLKRLPGASGRRVDAATLESLRPALDRMAQPGQPAPSIPELAARCRLSEATLRRRFLRALGMTTKAWLDRNRILRAAERLRDPRARILQVALDCGFATTSGFSRQFRAVLGMSPRAWRGRGLSDSARS